MIIWHNGRFIEDGPVLSIHDRIRLGEGVFCTALVVDGAIMHARAHLEKLLKNSKLFLGEWDTPAWEELHEAALELLDKNDFLKGRYAFNTIITGGPAGNGIRTPEKPEPQILMRALPLDIPSAPVEAIIAQSVRRNEGSPLSNIKCAGYGDNILALREAASKGANEAIMLTNTGNVSCATTSNILIVQGGSLWTPPLSDGCQNGVTRALAMEKLGARERSFTAGELARAEGIYLINSLRGAVPVVSLDGAALPAPAIKIERDFHIQ